MGFLYIQADSRQTFKTSVNAAISGLEKSACPSSACNPFVAYSFPAAQVVRSGEANEQLYNILYAYSLI